MILLKEFSVIYERFGQKTEAVSVLTPGMRKLSNSGEGLGGV
jgi:hypothetical protein